MERTSEGVVATTQSVLSLLFVDFDDGINRFAALIMLSWMSSVYVNLLTSIIDSKSAATATAAAAAAAATTESSSSSKQDDDLVDLLLLMTASVSGLVGLASDTHFAFAIWYLCLDDRVDDENKGLMPA
mmetsp:Transcript_10616/g.25327  ORF Transcript_10616/g.25327 Transcript_10616/m.25327 type:complete len:129 (+) Transcript_10616:1694-2080(+)